MLMLRPGALDGAILLRPMSPFAESPRANLSSKPILMLSGAMDPIVKEDDVNRLARTFEGSGAAIDHRTLPIGHGLSQLDAGLATQWLAARTAPLHRLLWRGPAACHRQPRGPWRRVGTPDPRYGSGMGQP
jgi:phospholipase/carboxylesterase